MVELCLASVGSHDAIGCSCFAGDALVNADTEAGRAAGEPRTSSALLREVFYLVALPNGGDGVYAGARHALGAQDEVVGL